MGLILDTSILIADERGKFDMIRFLREFPSPQIVISAIAAAALALGHELATLNVREFQRVTALRLVDASAFCRP